MIEHKCFIEDEVDKLDFIKEESITIDKIEDFENERARDWSGWGGYAIASIYYWIYLEKLNCKSQDFNTLFNWLTQIGLTK